jgi:hypothetical protein
MRRIFIVAGLHSRKTTPADFVWVSVSVLVSHRLWPDDRRT